MEWGEGRGNRRRGRSKNWNGYIIKKKIVFFKKNKIKKVPSHMAKQRQGKKILFLCVRVRGTCTRTHANR